MANKNPNITKKKVGESEVEFDEELGGPVVVIPANSIKPDEGDEKPKAGKSKPVNPDAASNDG